MAQTADDEAASVSSCESDAYVPFKSDEEQDSQWQSHPAFHLYTSQGPNKPKFPLHLPYHEQSILETVGSWRETDVYRRPKGRNLYYDPNEYTWTLKSYHPYWTEPGLHLQKQELLVPPLTPVYRYNPHRRPAILPVDAANNPTPYAMRFGIDPRAPLDPQGQAHSRLTPTDERFRFNWQSSDDREADDGFQDLFFRGYTSSELVETGVFNPYLQILPSDLNDELHIFVRQARWTQEPWTYLQCPGFWGGTWRIEYCLGDDRGMYDVNTNPRVWEALQPALRLVTRVLNINHPIFEACSNFYHIRQVPDSRDGRSPNEISWYGRHKSIWYVNDDDQMYPTARKLKERGDFDPRKAADAMIEEYLTLSLINLGALGITINEDEGDSFEIRCAIGVELVWPLLAPQYSESERASFSYSIAQTMLHEIGHAYRSAIEMMLTRPEFLQRTAYGRTLNPEIFQLLVELGNEMLPAYQPNIWVKMGMKWNGIKRGNGVYSEQWFFQDDVQGEDGMIIAKELWGNAVAWAPREEFGQPRSDYHPVILSMTYPFAHPQPFAQEMNNENAYTRYLADPPADVWSTIVARPVESYAGFLQQSWWTSEYRKYGAAALRFPPYDSQGRVLKAVIDTKDESMHAEIIRAFRSEETVKWVLGTAYQSLMNGGCETLAQYLKAATFQIASAKIFQRRLYYESKTWENKFKEIWGLVDITLDAVRKMEDNLRVILRDHPDLPFTADNAVEAIRYLGGAARNVAQGVVEVARVLGQDTMYCQNLAEVYLRQTPKQRARIYKRYISRLLPRVQELKKIGAGLVDAVSTMIDGENWESVVRRKLDTDLPPSSDNSTLDDTAAGDAAGDAGDAGGDAGDDASGGDGSGGDGSGGDGSGGDAAGGDAGITSPSEVRGYIEYEWSEFHTQVQEVRLARSRFMALGPAIQDVEALLDPSYVNDTPALLADPRVVKRARAGDPVRKLRTAALRELRELVATAGRGSERDRALRNVVRRWLRILNAHPDLTDTLLGVSRATRRFDNSLRRFDLMTEARSLLENEACSRRVRWGRRQENLPTINDPTIVELRTAIQALAGANRSDANYLGNQWSDQRIEATLNGAGNLDIGIQGLGI